MTPAFLPLLVVLPLLGAGISMALWRHLRLQQVLGVAVVVGALILSLFVLDSAVREGPAVARIGDWEPDVGIVLVADVFSAALLTVSLVTVLAVLVFAIGQPRGDKRAYYFHPLFLALTAGVSASFLAGDLFNLFVAFEIMLCASYVLLTLGGQREQMRSGMTYVVINLLASTLLVTSIGLIYAATGAVNMAQLALRLADLPPDVQSTLGILLLVTFGIKAAIFPLFFWLPDAYPNAPVTVTAVFAGLLTKVGVYAIIRTQTLLFPAADASPLLLWLAGGTMLMGVLGAIAQDDIKRVLSFAIISSIGYMIFGLGLSTTAGLAGAILYIISQIPVKTSLFLVNGIIETVAGTAALHNLGGLLRRVPAAAVLFLVAAASLAGIPPTSGFVGKLALVQAGFAGGAWVLTGLSLVVSALTMYAMTRIYGGAFWGDPPDPPPPVTAWGPLPERVPKLMTVATIGLVGFTVLLAIGAGPLWELSEQAATELLSPNGYMQTVLGP